MNIYDLSQATKIVELNSTEASRITAGNSIIGLGAQLGSSDSSSNPEQFAQLNAEFQAESQAFKIFQESINTTIKSIGEGMSSVARKS